MRSTSPGQPPSEEILLPLESPPPGPARDPAEPPAASVQPGRRARGSPPLSSAGPSPQAWVEEALRQLRLRQGEITGEWRAAAALLFREMESEVERLGEASTRAARELASAATSVDATVTSITDTLAAEMEALGNEVKAQTAALEAAVTKQGTALTELSRATAGHITVARHELALSVSRLRSRTFRLGILLGSTMALLVLLSARLLFPFWGMSRHDAEAWSRGMLLLESYEQGAPAEREAILRALGWKAMPGAAASPRPGETQRRGAR